MKHRQLFVDERAVSPVIGVILMVAITVILAAVIGTFVLGMGAHLQDTAPQATFTYDFTDRNDANDGPEDEIVITHEGGDRIPEDRLTVQVTGLKLEGKDFGGEAFTATPAWSSGEIRAGDSLTIDNEIDLVDSNGNAPDCSGASPCNTDMDLNAATIQLIWTSAGGGESSVLGTWKGTDA